MPRLLDDRIVGGTIADVVNRSYTGAAEGWVLSVDATLNQLVLSPNLGPRGPTGLTGPGGGPGPQGSPGLPGAPGTLNAWGTFNLTAQTWISWYNIASVEPVQEGRLRFTFLNAMPSAQYSVVATTWTPAFNTGAGGSGAGGNDNAIRVNSLTVNSFEITWLDRLNGTLENPSGVSFMVLAVPVPVLPAPTVILPPPPPPPPPPPGPDSDVVPPSDSPTDSADTSGGGGSVDTG